MKQPVHDANHRQLEVDEEDQEVRQKQQKMTTKAKLTRVRHQILTMLIFIVKARSENIIKLLDVYFVRRQADEQDYQRDKREAKGATLYERLHLHF